MRELQSKNQTRYTNGSVSSSEPVTVHAGLDWITVAPRLVT